MIKPHSDPYGYKKLLIYRKADDLLSTCISLARQFPRDKTMFALADQMNRSARSGKQNIVEGWKRNSTKEYFEFLGFSIGAIAELEEDCDDIIKGRYKGLMGKMGVMGDIRKWEEREKRGEKGEGEGKYEQWIMERVEKIRFYPLDISLPPVIQLKLKCKELNFLLSKLQGSLERKMREEKGMSVKQVYAYEQRRNKQADEWYENMLKEQGKVRLINGQVVSKDQIPEGAKLWGE